MRSTSIFSLEWNFKDDTLTISGIGKMPDFSDEKKAPWENKKIAIKKIIIDYGVQSIGDSAFKGCGDLQSITIPDSVQSIGDIVVDSFYDSSYYKLRYIIIPKHLNIPKHLEDFFERLNCKIIINNDGGSF